MSRSSAQLYPELAANNSTQIPFALCSHTTPPTPRPFSRVQPKQVRSHAHPAYPGRCLPCDISYRNSTQSLILETYNGLISDERSKLILDGVRPNTKRLAAAKEAVSGLKLKRDSEVDGVWKGFVATWNSGIKFKESRGTGRLLDRTPETMCIWLEARREDGALVVKGFDICGLRLG